MRTIMLEAPAQPLCQETIERAWNLVRAMGMDDTHTLIIDGITNAPTDRRDVVDGWVALAQGVDELMHATRH